MQALVAVAKLNIFVLKSHHFVIWKRKIIAKTLKNNKIMFFD